MRKSHHRVRACVCVGVQWHLVGLDGDGASPATTAFRFDYRVELQDMDCSQRSQLLASVHCYDTTVRGVSECAEYVLFEKCGIIALI